MWWWCLNNLLKVRFQRCSCIEGGCPGNLEGACVSRPYIYRVVIGGHLLRYIDTPLWYINTPHSIHIFNHRLRPKKFQNFAVWWTANELPIPSKILKIGAVLHLITSVEVDVFEVLMFFRVRANSVSSKC